MEHGTLQNFYSLLDEFLHGGVKRTYCVVYTQTEVNYGKDEDCDVEWCEKNGVPCYEIERAAGCCVNAAGSINIADIRKNEQGWVEHKLLPDFRDWLISLGLHADVVHNDVLVDGYKVASGAGINLAPDFKWEYSCFQFSINQDLNVIEHACKKPKTKDPKGLSEYGITTTDVVSWLENWFSEYDKEGGYGE